MKEIDKDKVIKHLELCSSDTCHDCKQCQYLYINPEGKEDPVGGCMDNLMKDALELLTPHVLDIDSVKRIGEKNFLAYDTRCLTVVWVEELGHDISLYPAELEWDEDDDCNHANASNLIDIYTFGDEIYEIAKIDEYGKTWRCWSEKPSETQRVSAPWGA